MPYIINEDCVKCGACFYECPQEAIIESENSYVIDPEKCIECGTCLQMFCPAYAIIQE